MADPSPRRSTRLQASANSRASTQQTTPQQVQITQPPVRKRRKSTNIASGMKPTSHETTATNGRRKRGKLWKLREVPLDILFEIFELLHPSDLLRLSRTSKSFRACLLSPTATSVWKRARGNVEGVPERPPHLTEPQYAQLLFEHICHFCGTSGITDVHWECWVRSCHKCVYKHFVSQEEVDIELPQCKDHDLLPFIWDPRPRRYDRLYLKSQVVALSKRFASAKSQTNVDNLVRETVNANMELLKHISACRAWYHLVRHRRAVELSRLRKERMQGIQVRMEAQGWAEEFEKMAWSTRREYMRHPAVNQAKPLTDRIWRNMETSITQLFNKFKEERIRRERIEVLCRRCDIFRDLVHEVVLTHPPLARLPTAGDLLEIPAFKEIIFRPSDEEVNEASFDLPMLRVDLYALKWIRSVYSTLRALLPEPVAPDETPGTVERLLSAATTFFRCAWCARPVPYPQIIHHRCMRQCVRYTCDDFEAKCLQHLRTEPWLKWGERLEFDTVASKVAESIVRACGKDPKETTYFEMELLDEFYVCPHCSDDNIYVAMTWRRAIYHVATTHRQGDLEPLPWRVLPSVYKAEMQAEEDEQQPEIVDKLYLMCCTRCRAERMTPNELIAHFVFKHQESLDEIRQDAKCFYVHPDVSDRCTPREVRLKIRDVEDETEEVNSASDLSDLPDDYDGSPPVSDVHPVQGFIAGQSSQPEEEDESDLLQELLGEPDARA